MRKRERVCVIMCVGLCGSVDECGCGWGCECECVWVCLRARSNAWLEIELSIFQYLSNTPSSKFEQFMNL